MAMMKEYSNKYTKIEKEDPNETIHRRAQFLIHKILQRADKETSRQQQRKRTTTTIKPSFRVVGIRLKIGKKLRKLRKRHGDLMPRVLRYVRRCFFCSSPRDVVSDLPPLFSLHV